MGNIVSLVKVILFNLLLALGLVGALLLAPPIAFEGVQAVSSLGQGHDANEDARGYLDLYADVDWANRHFREFSELSTSYNDYITWRRDDYSGETINIVDGVRITHSDRRAIGSSGEFSFFGGSTTWGTGVSDELTYLSIFARENSVQATNFGESGYIARQSLSYLQNLLIQSDRTSSTKKTVVFYDGANDVALRCRTEISGLGTEREAQIRQLLSNGSEEKYSFKRTFSQLKDMLESVSRKTVVNR